MAKKNLARTVLEAGRSGGFKFESRNTTRRERAEIRTYLDRVRCDPEIFDGEVTPCREPIRRYSYSDVKFAPDKLTPAYRWLDSRVGQPWNKTRGELRKKFDARTTPGRHILFDHLIPEVEPNILFVFSEPYYTVDENGLLRKNRHRRVGGHIRSRLRYDPPTISDDKRRAWFAGREVHRRGRHLYWFVQTDAGFFRQDRRLTADEVAFWDRF